MDGCACKQYIFRSYNTSTFNAVSLDENPLTSECEKENKKDLKFCTFNGRFQVTLGSEGVKSKLETHLLSSAY